MRRIWWFWSGPKTAAAQPWRLTPDEHRRLLSLLSEVGLQIVHEAHGPSP